MPNVLTALQILQQFNVVDYTNFSSSSDIEGRAIVGGNVTGSSWTDYGNPTGTGQVAPPASNFQALTVYGNITGGNIDVNNSGNVNLVGTGSGFVDFNGGHLVTSTPPEALSSIETTLNAMSSTFAGLSANSTINATDFNDVKFNAVPNSGNVAVFSVSAANLENYHSLELDNANSSDTIIINVTGTGSVDLSPNFIGNGSFTSLAGHNVIWNFSSSITTIDFQSEWYGAVVATGATIENSSPIDGTVVADDIVATSEFHQWTYQGSVPCFAAGTGIATPTGDVAVEALTEGDLVFALANDELTIRPIKWLGRRRTAISAHPRPETVAPIRIQRGAFADAVPHRDLLVSPDHAIFVDGVLICARQLVNGTTIRQVTGLTEVTYFHVELDRHAVLLAEGLAVESYLDTGNRGIFVNSDEPTVLHPDMTDEAGYPTRKNASCAPFVFDDAGVRPVWDRLAERAAELGQPVPAVETVTDPGVRVVAGGRTIRPIRGAGDGFRFILPKGATEVRLLSNATLPTVVTPWQEDRRRLGLYVERIVLHSGVHVSEIPVDHPSLTQGWWDVEGAGRTLRRWTDGEAVLPLPDTGAPVILEIRAGTNGAQYAITSEPTSVTAIETQRIAA
jgi:choice-of-anchor A domain-containing protein